MRIAEQARSLWAQVEQRTTDLRFLAALDADLHDTTTENRWDRRSVLLGQSGLLWARHWPLLH